MEEELPLASVDADCSSEKPEQTYEQDFNSRQEQLLEQIKVENLKIILTINCSKYPESTGQSPSPAIVNLNEQLKIISTLDIAPETSLTIQLDSFFGTIDSEMVSELRTSLSAIKNVNQLMILETTTTSTRNPYTFCIFSRFDYYFSFIYLNYNYESMDGQGFKVGFKQLIQPSIISKEYHFAGSSLEYQLNLNILLDSVFAINSELNACRITPQTRQLLTNSHFEVKSAEILNLKQFITIKIGFLKGFIENVYRISHSLLRLIEFDESRIFVIKLIIVKLNLPFVQQTSNKRNQALELEQLGKLPILKHLSLIIPDFRFDSIDSDLFSLVQFVKSVRISFEKRSPIQDCQIDQVLKDIVLSKSNYSNLTSFSVDVSCRDQIKPMLAIANALPNLERFCLLAIYPPKMIDFLTIIELSVPLFNRVKELYVTELLRLIEKRNLLQIVICPTKYIDQSNALAILATITAFPRPINVHLMMPFETVLSLDKSHIINKLIQRVLYLPNVCNFNLVVSKNQIVANKKKDEFQFNSMSNILISRNSVRTSIVAYDSFIKPYLTFNPAIILFDLYEDF